MPDIEIIHEQQGRYLDAMIAAFEEHLRAIVAKAQAKLTSFLHTRLATDGDAIEQTAANLRLMRNLDKKFMQFMDEAGYSTLVNAFVNEFPGQLHFLQETIAWLSSQLAEPLPPITFSADDLKVFGAFRVNTIAALDATIEAAAATAVNQVMFSIGGLKFSDLVSALAEKLEMTIPRAVTLANTAQSIFYRTATDQAYQAMEKELPQREQRYRYTGPDDAKTRPFCHHMLKMDKDWSREEIDRLDNGQLPNVWITQGGWNCRHVWLLSIRALEQRAGIAA